MHKYTMDDVAKLANVSKTTVSRVINDKKNGVSLETRNHILKIVEELNYRPNTLARSVATASSKTIGLVIPDISNLFYPEIMSGINDYISIKGYSMMVCSTNGDPENEKKIFLNL